MLNVYVNTVNDRAGKIVFSSRQLPSLVPLSPYFYTTIIQRYGSTFHAILTYSLFSYLRCFYFL